MRSTSFTFWIPRQLVRCVVIAGAVIASGSAALAAQTPNQPDRKLAPAQLDSLVAPIALYADPLLAQVMLAATFPEQIQEAAQYVRANGTRGIDDQPWDVSVKAVAHYPTVVNMMDARIDWTTNLGQAYAAQSTDIMQAVQHMRSLAQAQGNLVSTQQQEVVVHDRYIAIWPAQPSVVYVPVYDPAIVYFRPCCYGPRYFFSFGVGYPIGPWLIYDWDWPGRRIYYTGWAGGGWIARSRPIIVVNNAYVNDRFRNVGYNRDVFVRSARVDHVGRVRGFDGQQGFYRDAAVHTVGRDAGEGRQTGFTPVAREGGNRTAVPLERENRPLVTRGSAAGEARAPVDRVRDAPPPSVRSTPREAQPGGRSVQRYDGGGSAPRTVEPPMSVYRGGGASGPMGGSARQAAPAPRQSSPSSYGGARSTGRSNGRRSH